MTEHTHTPGPLEIALNHVREHHPEVTQVLFLRAGYWHYMSEDGAIPDFGGKVDVGLLEDAMDAAYEAHRLPHVVHIDDFGPNAIAAAEADLLGEMLAALQSVGEWCDLIEQNYPEMLFTKRVRTVLTKAGKAGQ